MHVHTKLPLVLDVNDSLGARALLAPILKSANLDVLQARDGATALAIASRSLPDVVLLDVSLPDIDGYEVTRRLRAAEATAGIPVVHTSSEPTPAGAKQASFEAGAAAYLGQPFEAYELVAVLGSLARLRQSEVAALRRARVLEADNSKLGRRVADLLELARFTQGKVLFETAPVDLRQVVVRVAEAARPLFERHHVDLAVESGSASVVVEGDAPRLEQVVAKLLDNALKYTPSGGRVKIKLSVMVEEPLRARLAVKDSGIGIDRKLEGGLSQLSFQDGTTLARRDGGLGVGLTVVERLVDIHGGTVRVSSEGLGLGTEFSVVLPLRSPFAPATEPATGGAVTDGRPDGKPGARRVLLVDDHADTRDLFHEVLRSAGHLVTLACNGEQAIALLLAQAFEVAVIDIGLPGMDGYEVARIARERLGEDAPLLLAMTGYGGPREREASERAGFGTHLVKPVEPSALVAAIARASRPSASGS
jgi:CheY-like chemotaxis protein/two-component sensor histidine kinase